VQSPRDVEFTDAWCADSNTPMPSWMEDGLLHQPRTLRSHPFSTPHPLTGDAFSTLSNATAAKASVLDPFECDKSTWSDDDSTLADDSGYTFWGLAVDRSCMEAIDDQLLNCPTDAFADICWDAAVRDGRQSPPAAATTRGRERVVQFRLVDSFAGEEPPPVDEGEKGFDVEETLIFVSHIFHPTYSRRLKRIIWDVGCTAQGLGR
jgi:hypothetical protein